MYSKQEASILTQQFWTSFGQYIAPVLSAEGEKINWINYKTGQKDISFNMMADSKGAKIAIVLKHKDPLLQILFFNKLLKLKSNLHLVTGEEWQWQLHTVDQYGKTTSEIYLSLQQVNVFNKADWPAIISYFKDRIIALDRFWCEYKYALEDPAF